MNTQRASRPSRFWSCAGANIVIALLYYALAELSRNLAATPNAVTPVWPSDGLAVGATLPYGNWVLPGVCLGSFLANVQAFWNLHHWHSLLMSIVGVLGIAGGTTLGTWLGTGLLRQTIRQRYPFNRVADTIHFLVYPGLIGPIVNATVGVTMVVLTHKSPWSGYGEIWLIWWVSNVAGIFILTPVLLSWNHWMQSQPFSFQPQRSRSAISRGLVVLQEKGVEALVLAGFTLFIGKASFWDGQPLAYMLIPLLVWAAFRLGQPGTTLIMFLTATIAIAGTVRGLGTFAGADLNQSLVSLQSFTTVVVFTSLVLVAVLAEQREAESRLKNAFTELQVANTELETLNRAIVSTNQELVFASEKIAAQQAALLQAEQARSQELERANNALQGTVATLADRRDLEGFIGEVLHTIAREFESPLVEYWQTLAADTVEVHTWLYDNQLFSLKQNDSHPGRGGIRLLPEYIKLYWELGSRIRNKG